MKDQKQKKLTQSKKNNVERSKMVAEYQQQNLSRAQEIEIYRKIRATTPFGSAHDDDDDDIKGHFHAYRVIGYMVR